MKSAKDYLESEKDRLLTKASNITDKALAEDRALSDSERSEVEGLIKQVGDYKSRIQEMEDNESIQKSIESMRATPSREQESAPGATSIGDAFVKSDVFRGLQAGFKAGSLSGNWTSGAVEIPWDGKATLDTATGGATIQPDVRGGILPTLFRRLTIADLIASGSTDSNTYKYVQETVATNNAAAVAEGALKPESAFEFGDVDEPVRKIATFLPVSDEMLEDVSQLRSYLDGRLALFVEHERERQLLSGSGTAPNLRGLLNRTGIQTAAVAAPGAGVTNDDTVPDLLFAAITAIRTAGLVEPDGIVMHPTNWAAVRTAKDNNGQYYAGGPFTGAYGGGGGIAPDTIWGKPVVVTSAIPENTALVGAFQTQAQYFRRGGLTVEASNSHADFFQRNLTAIRAEERLALAVYRPVAFHTITGLQNVGATG